MDAAAAGYEAYLGEYNHPGSSDPLDVSSLIGAVPGTSLQFSFSTAYDAGTEAEDFAFAPGGGLVGITTPADPAGGTQTASPITVVSGPDPFASFANLEPMGFDTSSIDFTGGVIGTLTVTHDAGNPYTANLMGGLLKTYLPIVLK